MSLFVPQCLHSMMVITASSYQFGCRSYSHKYFIRHRRRIPIFCIYWKTSKGEWPLRSLTGTVRILGRASYCDTCMFHTCWLSLLGHHEICHQPRTFSLSKWRDASLQIIGFLTLELRLSHICDACYYALNAAVIIMRRGSHIHIAYATQ